MTDKKIPLIIINGPTAVGKTAVSVELAKRINAEIISADSMQVYRRMNIGTAKITPEEMQGIPHHLIDIIEPSEEFNVIKFKELAKAAIEDIYSRGKIPVIAGGTGYYIQAVLYDIAFTEYDDERQAVIRAELEEELNRCGSLYMHERLKKIDPVSAGIIHQNNTKKLLHAIEYYMLTGNRISEHNEEQAARTSPYDFSYFVITDDRDKIYERINLRVDRMLEDGLEAEVRGLIESGIDESCMSMLGIGYKEMCDYIYDRVSLFECAENIKRETRHFAKKQLTWFKREKCVEYINRGDFAGNLEIAEEIERRVKERYFKGE